MADLKNILLTSAGRRVVLLRLLKRELKMLYPQAKVFAADMYPALSPACELADGRVELPRVTGTDYLPHLAQVCEKNEIGLIIPTIDTELLALAQNRKRLEAVGAKPVISEADFIRVCRDKRLTHDFFIEKGLNTPAIYDPSSAAGFPLFAKPYDGSCSTNTHLIEERKHLTPALLADPKLIFMSYLPPEKHDEYTIDMYYDRLGVLKCLVPRLRLETRAGEVSKGRTVWLPEMEGLRARLARIEGARGCITVQVIVNRKSGEIFGIEINPRFGGGYPLSDEAGATYVKWIIQEYLGGESIRIFDDWERNLTMLRYDEHVLVRDPDS